MDWTKDKPTKEGYYWFKGYTPYLTQGMVYYSLSYKAGPAFVYGTKWTLAKNWDERYKFYGPIEVPK